MSDIDDVQLRRLHAGLLLAFEAVLVERNLSRAGDRLGLTQSAVSHALARLRDIFGDPLFLRRPQGVAPTPRAETLQAPLAAALTALRGALAQPRAFDPARIDRLVAIVALDAVVATLGPPLFARLGAEAPGLRIAFRTAGREDSQRMVAREAADFAVGVHDAPGPGLMRIALFAETFTIVARRGHPAFRDGLTLEGWLAHDHFVVSAAGDLRGAVDPVLAALGLTRRTRAAIPQFLAALAMVAATDATATVPLTLASRHAGAFGLDLFDPPIPLPSFEMAILRRVPRAPDPELDWLIEAVRAVAPAGLTAPDGAGREDP